MPSDRRAAASWSRPARAARPARTSCKGDQRDHLRVDARGVAGVPDAARHVEGLRLGAASSTTSTRRTPTARTCASSPTRRATTPRRRCARKDGSIIFTSMRSGDLELWRMDADGKNVRAADEHARLRRRRVLLGRLHEDRVARVAADRQGRSTTTRRCSRRTSSGRRRWSSTSRTPTAPRRTRSRTCRARRSRRTSTPTASASSSRRTTSTPRGPEFDLFGDQHRRHAPRADHVRGRLRRLPDVLARRQARWRSRRTAAMSSNGRSYRVTGTPAGEHDTNVFVADWEADIGPVTYRARDRGGRSLSATDVDYLADDAREGRGVGTKGLEDAERVRRASSCRRPASSPAGRTSAPAVRGHDRRQARRRDRARRSTASRRRRRLHADRRSRRAARSRARSCRSATASSTRREVDDYKGKSRQGQDRARPPVRAAETAARTPDRAARLGDLRYKAFLARGQGAIGLIVVDDGDPKQDEAPLPPLGAGARSAAGRCRHRRSSSSSARPRRAKARSAQARASSSSRCARRPSNVVGVHPRRRAAKLPGVVVIGAHVDHLGMGGGCNALDSEGPRGAQRRRRQRLGRRRAARGRARARGEEGRAARATSTSSRSPARRRATSARRTSSRSPSATKEPDRRDAQHGHGRPHARQPAPRQRRRVGEGVEGARRAGVRRARASSARSAARATARPITWRSTSPASRCCSSSPATTSTITPPPTTPTRSTRPAARASR